MPQGVVDSEKNAGRVLELLKEKKQMFGYDICVKLNMKDKHLKVAGGILWEKGLVSIVGEGPAAEFSLT